MTCALVVLGGALLWHGRPTALPVLLGALFLLGSGIFVPRILLPIERVWMKFAEVLGAVMTRVILTVAFYAVITPMGVIVRFCGKDLLQLKLDKSARSYWMAVEQDGPAKRHFLPY